MIEIPEKEFMKISEEAMIEKLRMTIGIIDDDPDIISFIEHELGNDYNSHPYSWNGIQGQLSDNQETCKAKVDLFILDINLPGITGFDIGKAVRKFLGYEVPIIYISANTSMKKYLSNDQRNTYFMPKPFKRQEIKKAVDAMTEFI